MGEIKLFQMCYEGDLNADVSYAMRHLGAEPNFDQSWCIWLSGERHAAPLIRYLRPHLGADARLIVACAQFTTRRDFLLVRHSLTFGADYCELHAALDRLGIVVELPFDSTFVIRTDDQTDVQTLGRALGELCPDDSIMVTGISHDWAYSESGASRMFVGGASESLLLRPF
jgi:hypothetical protein